MQLTEEQLKKLYDPKLTPATLTAYLDPTWIPAKHLMFISKKIATAVKRGGGRIIVSVPPRHGKSRMLSIGGTTWVNECFPDYNVGLVTYGLALSTDFSGAVREQIERNEDKLSVRIRKRSNRIDKFLLEGHDGGVFAAGLGGVLTGRGFHVLFLDDYIKQLKEAVSPTYRQQTWDWWVTTAYTRLEPNATVVIVATRWHKDDLIGRILEEFKNEWEYIRIPAIAEDNDPIGRMPGEALFPERYDIEALESIKRLLGSFWFSAIYQQNPRDDSSAMANKEWLQYTSTMPHPATLRWARIWDFAGLKDAGDYSCGLLMGADVPNSRAYLADIVRGQWSPDRLDTLFEETAKADSPEIPIIIAQEPGASGLITTNHFKKLLGPQFRIKGVPELQNKITKAHGMLAGAERGDLILKHAPWNRAFADEFDSIPDGEHDDQIDCASIGWNELIGVPKIGATWGRNSTTSQTITKSSTPRPGGIIWGKRKSGIVVPIRKG